MSDTAHILLVDDDEDTLVIVRRLLNAAGSARYDLDWAPTFEDGLARIEASTYAAVLIDYRLGARDGLELLDEVVSRELAAPVIMLTGQGGREIDIEAMHRGASDYLAKDRLDGETLDRSIRYAVERHRLMDDLRDHAGELARRAEELQRMNESLEQFVWAASHDLQTPLRTIIYRLQYLRMMHGALEGADSIDSAAQAAKRMSLLLHDLLHYVRSGSDDFSRTSVDCGQLLELVMEHFTVAESSPSLSIDVGTLPTVIVNQNMLLQVFQNLIHNAIAHSGGHAAHVRVSAQRDRDGWAFRVEDEGTGVDPADAELIFQPFRRSGRSHDSAGSGIGLALCRRIIERHGGRIWCESRSEPGAAFVFTIPDLGADSGDTCHELRTA